MRRKLITCATVLALFSQFFVSPAQAAKSFDDPPPPPEEIIIDSVTAHGSGCPPGTTSVELRPDHRAFTVIYGAYVASVGLGAGRLDFRKNCQISVLVRVPDGYTYAVSRVDHSGYAGLAAGATAFQRASYFFQGSTNTSMRTHTFTSPYDDTWHFSDESDLTVIEYHPCGVLRNLNINTELRVNVGTSDPTTTSSVLSMDFSDTYRFHWKRCPSTP